MTSNTDWRWRPPTPMANAQAATDDGPSEPRLWMRLLGAAALVLLACGVWMFARAGRRAEPRGSAAAPVAAGRTGPTAALPGTPALHGASWDLSPPPDVADKPSAALREAERKRADFANEASKRWQGIEIFVQRR